MSYQIDKKTGEITIAGWEKGIGTSPHIGLGDIKGLNISSMPGEVMVNYDRVQQSQVVIALGHASLTAATASTLTCTGLQPLNGSWITISGSSITNLTNSTSYYVKSNTAGTLVISTSYEGSTKSDMGVTGSASFVTINMAKPIAWASSNLQSFPKEDYFVLDANGLVWYQRPTTFTTWRLIDNTTEAGAGGLFCYGIYVFICTGGTSNALKYKSIAALATSWTNFQDLNFDSTGASSPGHYSLVSHNGVVYIGDGSYVDTLATVPGQTFDPTSSGTYTWTSKALIIQLNDVVNVIAEIASGNQTTLLIGGQQNVIYPWDGLATTFGALIYLPENNTTQMVSVNNVVYIFCGSKGNVYITNGSSVTAVITVPDYIANNTGTNQDPYFIWGGAMYLRGRVWFSVKAPNCGGIWSFVPTINYYIQQDTGASLRLESQNSYGTYNGYAPIIFSALAPTDQQALGPQYWSAWDNGSSVYGIDYSATTPFVGGSIIETDLIPTGTILNKNAFKQLEYKLSAPLATGESIQLYYRMNLTDSFLTCGTAIQETTINASNGGTQPMSGYYPANFENTQWIQFRIVLTSTASSPSWCRLAYLYLR